ncbi:BZ3500_MvSof-1268-A1-R1_Chr10-1g02595 [Microbotryum saponariae]|uniref:BZ3500_MvSof-1268-A1-R1_Chr10-1g02595 protein n=1 Tax=Microbotryum saponariae TaxID=289078 RepID=A0A2X0N8W5_9BASI|nr:BZ3500_MvSof-1268-A1-R1_Chr10-1g02595 [Microbotryum saponariae]SDA06084.1 BZ3501_MvSof-1269-A2-R1_Chr10-1g02196 [Microbotryum saponariae]
MPKLKKKTSQPRKSTTPPLMTAPSTPHKATTSLAPVSLLSASPLIAAAEATDAVVTVVADHADLVSLREAHSLPRSVDSSASSVRTAHSSTHTFDHSTTDQQSTAGTSPSSPSALRALRERLAADAEAQHQQHLAATNTDDSPNKLRKKRPPPSLLAEHQQSSAEEGKGEELGQPSVEQATPEVDANEDTVEAAQDNASQSSQSESNGASSKDLSPIDHSEAYRLRDPTPFSESALFSLALAPPRFARRVASSTTSFAYNTTVRAVYLPVHLARSAVDVPISIAQSLPVVGGYLNSSSEPTSKEPNSTANSPRSPTEPTSRKTSFSNMPPRLSRPSEHEGTISSCSSPEDDDEFGPKGLLYRTAETAAGVAIAATILPFAAAGLMWGAWVRRGEMKGKTGTSWGKGT